MPLIANRRLGHVGPGTEENQWSHTVKFLARACSAGHAAAWEFFIAQFRQELYRAARAWVGHYPGGIAMATIGGCAAFGAICGSSVATGATMATVALPEMKRYGYSGALATGALAAGGTLGILIPPSIILVIYAILTQTDVGKLFIAGIIPGLINAVINAAVIFTAALWNPAVAPAAPS